MKTTALIIASVLLPGAHLFAQSTAFTYQGRLNDGAVPANGLYEFQFSLYDAVTNGALVGTPVSAAPVQVTNGIFTVTLDFGAAPFNGNPRWLGITVNLFGSDMIPTVLHPRQPITVTPYAINAYNLMSPGSGPLDIKVGGLRALRLEPTSSNGTVNVIGGSSGNFVTAGVVGATIAGGGTLNYLGVARTNRVLADFGTVGGGRDNVAAGTSSTIAGGSFNTSSAFEGTIGGGRLNIIEDEAYNATISGGRNNLIENNAFLAAIGGGDSNTNQFNAPYSVIAGGLRNFANGPYSSVGGGEANLVGTGNHSTVAGGFGNTIGSADGYNSIAGGFSNGIRGFIVSTSTIGGGWGNLIYDFSVGTGASTIAGGAFNEISIASGGAIGGGTRNTVFGNGATVPGGTQNRAQGNNSFAAGQRAVALGEGTFVWADSSTTNEFASSAANQFCIRAAGGVGINRSPLATLHVLSYRTSTVDNTATFMNTNLGSSASHIQYGRTGDWYIRSSTNTGKVVLQDTGGNVGVGTTNPGEKLHVVGNIFATGSITPNSDRHAKTDIEDIDSSAILDRVTALPIKQWRFKTEAEGVKHVGPMAQDFHAAFGLGARETAIATVDADGVALAAIQAINQKLEQQMRRRDERIAALETELAALRQLLLEGSAKER
jgi:trimeric autotransporter adhesin